jgi:hypothetical protein
MHSQSTPASIRRPHLNILKGVFNQDLAAFGGLKVRRTPARLEEGGQRRLLTHHEKQLITIRYLCHDF